MSRLAGFYYFQKDASAPRVFVSSNVYILVCMIARSLAWMDACFELSTSAVNTWSQERNSAVKCPGPQKRTCAGPVLRLA